MDSEAQKRPTLVSKETYSSVKRDLTERQQRWAWTARLECQTSCRWGSCACSWGLPPLPPAPFYFFILFFRLVPILLRASTSPTTLFFPQCLILFPPFKLVCSGKYVLRDLPLYYTGRQNQLCGIPLAFDPVFPLQTGLLFGRWRWGSCARHTLRDAIVEKSLWFSDSVMLRCSLRLM